VPYCIRKNLERVYCFAIETVTISSTFQVIIPKRMRERLKAKEGQPARALILKGIERVLNSKPLPVPRIVVPLIRSKRPGTLMLDNARIYEVIGFPLLTLNGFGDLVISRSGHLVKVVL